MKELDREIRDLKGLGICTIGPATACVLEERGIRVDLLPDSFIAESVVKAFQDKEIMRGSFTLPSHIRVACIGPVTAKAAYDAGMKTDIMQEPYTMPGMVEAVIDFYGKAEINL